MSMLEVFLCFTSLVFLVVIVWLTFEVEELREKILKLRMEKRFDRL